MKITKQWLEKHNACQSGIDWVLQQETNDMSELIDLAMKEQRYGDLNWFISRKLNKKKCVMYAVFAAEQVIHIYEENYPDDDRPRKAIEAAKKCIKNPTDRNKSAAYAASYAAADADAYAAAYAAASAYADAAAYAAAASVYAAAVDDGAEKQIKVKILEYGIQLLKEEK